MTNAKVFLVSIIWLFILGIAVLTYRLWWKPTTAAKQEKQQEEVVEATSGTSSYQHTFKLGLDGFSGYAVLRSPQLKEQLRTVGIKVETIDDGANYNERMAALADGRLAMAAFPLDALLTASSGRKLLPATVVALIDETRGADALVAYREKFPNIDSLNNPETRFVLVSGSPSETLFRVLLHDFQLDRVSPKAILPVGNADEVIKRYKAAQPSGNEVFITWEPYISQLKTNESMQVLLDTSRQSGYIVDALVVNRDYLVKNEPVVRKYLEAYFRTLYEINKANRMLDVVQADAAATGMKLTRSQAEELVNGIHWKNTQENLAHFGLVSAPVMLIEDMLDRIRHVLVETKALGQEALSLEARKLFTERPLKTLNDSGFHPGVNAEEIRGTERLAQLNDLEWSKLVPVGTLSSPPLIFARSRATLTEASQVVLDELAQKLISWPAYYVKVVGGAGSIGDPEANKQLAAQRAQSTIEYLQSRGIPAERLRAETSDSAGEMSVSFVFGQLPY